CPAPPGPCLLQACVGNVCAIVAAPAGTEVSPSLQAPHDCQKQVCDSSGNAMNVADPSDLPVDPSGGCNTPSCNGPTPRPAPTAAGTACTQIDKGVCNGAGVCGACKPGATQCGSGNTVQQLCNAQGAWENHQTCAGVCSNGVCTGTCNPSNYTPNCVGTTLQS